MWRRCFHDERFTYYARPEGHYTMLDEVASTEKPLRLVNGGSSFRRADAATPPSCNHAYFRSVQTEPAAYWLGYLAGCGKIHEQDGRRVIDLEVPCEDLDHVAKFRSTIGSDATVKPIHIDDEPDEEPVYLWQLRLTSPKMVADLARYGLADTSPQGIDWPSLPERLLPHFLRGLSDGSGLDGLTVDQHRPPSFYISANRTFLTACESYLVRACHLDRALRIERATLRFTEPHEIAGITHLLCTDATIFLPSKRNAVTTRLSALWTQQRQDHGDL